MTRKCKLVLFGILALLLCVSVALGSFSLTVANADETTTGNETPSDGEQPTPARVIVLDQIEDFRTNDNGDGTYTILGLDLDNDFTAIDDFYSGPFGGKGLFVTNKTAFSATGLRKILGLEANDNVGLIKGEGDDVSADETDEAFEERVYAELCSRFFKGEIAENGYTQFGIVIPETVSEIEDFAFVSSYSYGLTGGTSSSRGLVGYYGKDRFLDYNGIQLSDDIDICEVAMELLESEPEEMTVEQQAVLTIVANSIGATYTLDLDAMECKVSTVRETPALVSVDYAVDQDGNRALATLGRRIFGSVYLDEITLPKDVDVVEAYAAMNTYQSKLGMTLDFKDINIEDGVTKLPEYLCEYSHVKEVVVPASVQVVELYGLGSPYLEKLTVLGECVEFKDNAFRGIRAEGTRSIYINSIEQWFSFVFESERSNPMMSQYSDESTQSFLYVSDGNGGWNELTTLVVPATRKVKDAEGNITEQKITGIPDYMFTGCRSITSLNFSNDITSIGAGAFAYCTNLESVSMDSVTELGTAAFKGTALKSVRIPDGVTELKGAGNGAGTFAYCKSLTEVIFSNTGNLTKIGGSDFAGCTALESITIPASVEILAGQAFSSCTSLKNVTFAGDKITTLPMWCFSGCTSLESIVLPAKLARVGKGVFNGSSSLKEIVLPETVTTLDEGAFEGCLSGRDSNFTVKLNSLVESVGSNLFGSSYSIPANVNGVILAANKEIYTNFVSLYKPTLANRTIATYPVQVKYVYNGITLSSEFYNYNYALPESISLNSFGNEWYADEQFTQGVTAANVLSALSANADDAALIDENGIITLYTNEVIGEIFVGRSDLVYNGESYSGTDVNALLTDESFEITDEMTVTIKTYTDVFGNVAEVAPTAIRNAGTYVVIVEMDGSEQEFEIVIARRALDISALDWKVSAIGEEASGESLQSSRLYLYIDAQNAGRTYASLDYLDMSVDQIRSRYSLYGIVSLATNSIARYRDGAEITIGLNFAGLPADAFNVTYSGGYKASQFGMYDASADIAPSANYTFYVSDTTGFNASGRSMAASMGGGYIISKTWYVAGMANWLVNSDDAQYSFSGSFVFGDGVAFTLPLVKHGDVAASQYGTASDPLTFTIQLGNTVIGTFNRSNYARYINAVMPAGRYTLTVNVGDVVYEGSTLEGFARTFEFTVTAKALPATELAALNTALKGKSFNFDYDNAMHLLTNEVKTAIAALKAAVEAAQPNRTGTIWADSKYDVYYGNFNITFNLDRMRSSVYFTENDLNGEETKPVNPDKYVVYYLITANNFASLVNDGLSTVAYDSARREYVFNVIIVRTIDVPSAGSTIYNGNAQMSELMGNEFYTVDKYDGFTTGGEHEITLRLINSEFYRWNGHELGEETVKVVFTIAKATNEWIRVPNIVNWTFETFDTEVNRIRAVVKYLDNGQIIKLTITKADGTAIAGLSDFTVNQDGTTDNDALIAALNGLKVGSYKLVVTVDGTDNYNLLTQSVDFTIGKSINTWADGEDDLVLPSWIVGQFSLEENAIVVKAAHGEAIIEIRDMDGKVYYTSTNPEENTLNELEVGKYLLVAWVPESEDYAALAERSFTIEVLKKIGLPWWGTTLVAVGALGLAAAVILILWKLKVFEILTDKISLAITTRATVDATIAAVRATKKAEEADEHKRKVEARERLQAAREAHRNKTPEQRAQDLHAKAEATATRADEMHAKAAKMRERANKLTGNTEQAEQAVEQPEEATETDDTSTEE